MSPEAAGTLCEWLERAIPTSTNAARTRGSFLMGVLLEGIASREARLTADGRIPELVSRPRIFLPETTRAPGTYHCWRPRRTVHGQDRPSQVPGYHRRVGGLLRGRARPPHGLA